MPLFSAETLLAGWRFGLGFWCFREKGPINLTLWDQAPAGQVVLSRTLSKTEQQNSSMVGYPLHQLYHFRRVNFCSQMLPTGHSNRLKLG